jgi:hypothetical protein
LSLDNPAGHWLLRDGENSLLARRTVDGLRRDRADRPRPRALGRTV